VGTILLQSGAKEVTFDYSQTLGGKGALRITKVIYYSIGAGLVEEFYYRGLFKLLFKPGRGRMILYVLLSAIIFSSVHWEGGFVKLFVSFLLGLIFAGAYLWIKNLWPLVVAHFLTDFFLFY